MKTTYSAFISCFALALALTCAQAARKPPNLSDYDWVDGTNLTVEGTAFGEPGRPYARLGVDARGFVPTNVWNMSGDATGVNVRFVPQGRRLCLKWDVTNPDKTDAFMGPVAMTGLDVYEQSADGAWHFRAAPRLRYYGKENPGLYALDCTPGRACMVYLPLRSFVTDFKVGVEKGASVVPLKPHGAARRVVHYGTSIVHGGCVSRPGMAFSAQAGRRADVEVVNLGFSGHGRMELSMSETVARIDAALYVIDCDWNMSVELQRERYEPFVRDLRARRPKTPILLCGGCTQRAVPRPQEVYALSVYDKLKKEDPALWKDLHFLGGVEMLPKDGEATFDFCHPNDWGSMQMGRVYADAFARILGDAPRPRDVPELLRMADGRAVTTREMWERERRPELLKLFEDRVYGRRPEPKPRALRFEDVEPPRAVLDGAAVRHLVRAVYAGPLGTNSFVFKAFVPAKATAAKPAPAFVMICLSEDAANREAGDTKEIREQWPIAEIVRRGYATVGFHKDQLSPDLNHGNLLGVFSVYEKARPYRPRNGWGTLSAWAWGASRVMDWIETRSELDAKHVGVVGHSRGGKTALLTGVTDTRFALACSNDSGCSGAKLNHIDIPNSEHVAEIVRTFPYWFCPDYTLAVNREDRVDYDQHMFVALMAPRLVAIASATEDPWAGPRGEYASARLASPAWELYGMTGLGSKPFPEPNGAIADGCVEYHLRAGRHRITDWDWQHYLDFADRHGFRGK